MNLKELEAKYKEMGAEIEALKKQDKEWVTVTDGFRGSLKRDFWVQNSVGAWKTLTGFELIARNDCENFTPYLLLGEDGRHEHYKELKFKPFTIENPPPVDWLCTFEKGGMPIRFADTCGGLYRYFDAGRCSHNHLAYFTHKEVNPIWLNIEKVEGN